MFRFIFGVAALIAALAVAGLVLAGIGTLIGVLLFPLAILLKVAFFVFMFGLIASMFGKACGAGRSWDKRQWQGRHRWQAPSRWEHRETVEDRHSRDDRFEEWHRMAHAREEVDRHAPEVD